MDLHPGWLESGALTGARDKARYASRRVQNRHLASVSKLFNKLAYNFRNEHELNRPTSRRGRHRHPSRPRHLNRRRLLPDRRQQTTKHLG